MYEELIGKRVRVTKSDGFVKYGVLEEIENEDLGGPNSRRLLKIRKEGGGVEYVLYGTEIGVEEVRK